MAAQGFLLLASYLLVLLVLARPLGTCLARMVNDIPLPGLAGVERVLWRVAGIRAEEMGWLQYLLAILLFNALGGLALFALLTALVVLSVLRLFCHDPSRCLYAARNCNQSFWGGAILTTCRFDCPSSQKGPVPN